MGTFGRAFILANPARNGVGAPRIGIPKAGPFTKERGYLSYYEVSYFKNYCNEIRVCSNDNYFSVTILKILFRIPCLV